jgi:hypothetical protein
MVRARRWIANPAQNPFAKHDDEMALAGFF